ncbi:MAG: T9SS type A sorting domain-containing protein [Bacteroidetes bacterium]|nr:T9SS type A sorting domain-containing protein [Bacteroidota bacterium]
MRKLSKYVQILVFILIPVCGSFAQEKLEALEMNTSLYYKYGHLQKESLRGTDTNLIYVIDTVEMPFYDDFSTNKLLNYNYPDSFLYDVFWAGKCIDLNPKNTINYSYMLDTSWTYFLRPDTTLDSIAKAPIELVKFDDSSDCANSSGTLTVWPTYTNGHKIDTPFILVGDTFVKPDTSITVATKTHVAADTNSLWLDNFAFVNRTYADDAPSIGVATMDGIDELGLPYNSTLLSYGLADALTSKPINILPDDSKIFLSFFYQPQGLGSEPEPVDSLIVQFKRIDESWSTVWAMAGAPNQPFVQVVLEVDSIYWFPGFQFRFRNYATLSGNNDHWHIDYVRLLPNRDINDKVVPDFAITSIPNTLLSNYFRMPWEQFILNNPGELINGEVFSACNHHGPPNIAGGYNFKATHLQSATILDIPSSPAPAFNALPSGICLTAPENAAVPHTMYTVPNSFTGDTVVLRNEYWINNITPKKDIITTNDTVYFDQIFSNYYSYDDGTAELAYLLVGTNARLAYEFDVNTADTITSIAIHFPYLNLNITNNLYSLAIWDKNKDDTSLVYEKVFQKPNYIDSLNGFYHYKIDSLIIVSGKFYIGWIQTTLNTPMIVGFDVNDDASGKLWYNIGSSGWVKSSLTGAVMIRPVFAKASSLISSNPPTITSNTRFNIYPNPARHVLNIEVENLNRSTLEMEMVDMLGRQVYSNKLNSAGTTRIDLKGFHSGIYLIRLYDNESGTIITKKFILAE